MSDNRSDKNFYASKSSFRDLEKFLHEKNDMVLIALNLFKNNLVDSIIIYNKTRAYVFVNSVIKLTKYFRLDSMLH